jgi:ABC-2 type transport system ATP-binding protein
MNAIELTGLTKIFRNKKLRKVIAVENVSFSVKSGEIFGFLGPNGAGKSTTIKTIMGLITPSAGSVAIRGRSAVDPSSRASVGYLPENPSFYDFLTAREYLTFVGNAFSMAPEIIRARSEQVLTRLELLHAVDRPIRGYSKGMVQRLGLAQALLHDPDEPMSGLDPLGRALVKEIMLDLKQAGKTIFFSTHITNDVEVVCDTVGIIVGGVLRAVHEVNTLLRKGVEGYDIHLTNADPELLAQYNAIQTSTGSLTLFVDCDKFQQFIVDLSRKGGEVVLIETRRKDLESFFLDIVKQ